MNSATSTRCWLDYFGSSLELEVEHGADLSEPLRFLETHLAPSQEAPVSKAIALVRVAAKAGDRHLPDPDAPEEEIFVRKSANDFFTIPARRTRSEGREFLHCTRTGTRMAFDRSTRTIDVVMGAGGAMDFVELVRDLVLKDQENKGAVVLHATSAYRDGSAVLVAGAKGAGKSTILLELVDKFGFQVMSGDKTVVQLAPDGRVLAAGWPDYPHLGYGTVAKYDELARAAGVDKGYRPAGDDLAFSPYGKFALDPGVFRSRFQTAPYGVHVPVSAVIHPSIGPGAETLLRPFDDSVSARTAALAANVETAFEGGNAGWQSYLDDERDATAGRRAGILDQLGEVPAYTLVGPGVLTRDPFGAEVAS